MGLGCVVCGLADKAGWLADSVLTADKALQVLTNQPCRRSSSASNPAHVSLSLSLSTACLN